MISGLLGHPDGKALDEQAANGAQVISPQRKVYALKRIRLAGLDTESAQGFVDEIHLLRRLKGKPSIIQLVDAEVC
jgi:serine/threonine-protein kinase TTK/MPS1